MTGHIQGSAAGGVAASAAVEISDLSKVFNHGKPNEVHALDGIGLSIETGSFVSLIGPSGCGKSTLLRLIGALTAPTDGTVLVNGKSADQARLDRDYGMAFQTSGLFGWRTVTKTSSFLFSSWVGTSWTARTGQRRCSN